MPEQNFEQQLWGQATDNTMGNQAGQPTPEALNLGGLAGAPIHAVRQDIEGQMNGLIDHLAGQVPGGHVFAPEAKQAMTDILNGLQSQLENQAQARLGGLGGGLAGGNQGNQNNHGGLL